jgi:hypothetical protein
MQPFVTQLRVRHYEIRRQQQEPLLVVAEAT